MPTRKQSTWQARVANEPRDVPERFVPAMVCRSTLASHSHTCVLCRRWRWWALCACAVATTAVRAVVFREGGWLRCLGTWGGDDMPRLWRRLAGTTGSPRRHSRAAITSWATANETHSASPATALGQQCVWWLLLLRHHHRQLWQPCTSTNGDAACQTSHGAAATGAPPPSSSLRCTETGQRTRWWWQQAARSTPKHTPAWTWTHVAAPSQSPI